MSVEDKLKELEDKVKGLIDSYLSRPEDCFAYGWYKVPSSFLGWITIYEN